MPDRRKRNAMPTDAQPAPTGALPPPERRIFCNRTLNLRSIRAIGYDMDYTLIHYRVEKWEQRSFSTMRRKLREAGWPVGELRFAPRDFQRGLIIDLELGNILKANQFGYVKRAAHGTRTRRGRRRRARATELDPADPRPDQRNLQCVFKGSPGYGHRDGDRGSDR